MFAGYSVPARPVWDVNKHGGAHVSITAAAVKTPKYSGRADWEAFLNLNYRLMLVDGQ